MTSHQLVLWNQLCVSQPPAASFPWGGKGAGSVWQRNWTQTSVESLAHVSADTADTISFDVLKVWSLQGCEGWCFAWNDGMRSCSAKGLYSKPWAVKRSMRKFKTGSEHRHSSCPLSPVLCLFIAKSQPSLLPCFLYISVYLFSQDFLSHSSFLSEFITCLCSWLLLC